MARASASASIATFLRHIRGGTQTQRRRFAVECGEGESSSDLADKNPSFSRDGGSPNLEETAKEVSEIIRTKPQWEETLRRKFPSFNFADSQFFQELLKHQGNASLSFKFFHWLQSELGFVPDQDCCNMLFNSALDAKAHDVAKFLLELPNFSPELNSLERYVTCLCKDKLIHEAISAITRLGEAGGSPSIKMWNSVLICCLKVGRTDLLWKLYQDMIDRGSVDDVNSATVSCLIEAFAKDGEVGKGYELLKQVLSNGLSPRKATFNKLIFEFAKRGHKDAVSELLHMMIARNMNPDVYTYQEVINGLCKTRNSLGALKVFNDLKDRGYAPNKVIYTTLIHCLGKTKQLSLARQLWLEMIRKGIVRNQYTYNALIYGCFMSGDVEEAKKLYKEMCFDKDWGETTVGCNTMMTGFCLNGMIDDALNLFKSMVEKKIPRDQISFNVLICGFCKEGNIVEGRKLLDEMVALGLEPSAATYGALVQNLCLSGNIQEATSVWNEMQVRGLKPTARTYYHFVAGLCKEGNVTEAMNWLFVMLKNEVKPRQCVFERVVKCLLENGRVDDSLRVLNSMVKIGYYRLRGVEHSLMSQFPESHPPLVDSIPDRT